MIALLRVRAFANRRPVNVIFFVSEIAKWKAQSLYDLMDADSRFSPWIYVYPMRKELDLSDEQLSAIIEDKLSYFHDKNMRVINIWDTTKKCINWTNFKSCGLVFYQQTWDVPPAPKPLQISTKYLTFYIPYYLVNNYNKNLELCMSLHRHVFRYIVQSDSVKKFFYKEVCRYKFAGKLVGLGHTSTDAFRNMVRSKQDFTVIYAPHFSIPYKSHNRPVFYSTFLENGELILEYAQRHPEVKWVFKPHPRLKSELITTGVWGKERVNQYYEDWEKIGKSCYTADYQELFVNSDLMLTDCGSFLSEYACTEKPIIRMVSPLLNVSPNPALEELYSTYYCVHNNEELEDALNLLVVQRLDPNKDIRQNAIEKLGFSNYSAAEKIRDYISRLLCI